jgi:N-acetylmuramoyl-L-alanine amidase-like protein/VCBS repeat protein
MRRRLAVQHLGAVCALSVVATGLAVATPAVAAGPAKAPKAHAVAPSQQTVRLVGIAAKDSASLSAESGSASLRTAALTPAVPVASGISIVGATWPEGTMPATARLLVRTSTKGQWSAWQPLDDDDSHAPDPGTAEAAHERGGTQPYVVTDASAVQVRLDTTTGVAPADATVDVVDPGTSGADASVGTATAGAAGAAATQPTIYSRAQWGADESLRHGEVLYGSIQAAFVHHTVSQNNYTAAQVPAIIRGIYAFHVNGRGWNDIGYNFLVDRFGRIWEGRYGGITRPVVGAHTRDYNSNSFAMSAIGDYDVAHVPSAIVSAYERLFAWKLTLHGIPAIGTVVLNGHRINRISGHRDVGATACPGRYLYALLPTIRSGTSARMGALPRPTLTRSLDANTTPDILARTAGGGNTAFLTDATAPVGASQVIGSAGWDGLDLETLSPDLTGDGRPDLVARVKATGQLRIYAGDGHGHFPTSASYGRGWNSIRRIIAPGDVDSDGHADVLGVDATGRMLLYRGTGTGTVGSPGVVGASGWLAFSSVTGVGDVDGDGHPDLTGVRASTGEQMLYPGLGTGRFGSPRVIGTGWQSFDVTTGAGDLDGDGHPDLIAREAGTGRMRTYFRVGTTTYGGRLFWGASYQNLSAITGGQDVTGDGHPDLLGVLGGQLLLYPGTGVKEFGASADSPIDLSGTDNAFVVGDVNHDGASEVIARDLSNASLVMWADAGRAGTPATSHVVGTGWGGFDLIAPAGDLTMDGIPDVLARTTSGDLYVYPLTSTGAPLHGIRIATGMNGMTDIMGVGPNDAGAAPDVVAREPGGGALLLYGGNGPGMLLGPHIVRSSTSSISRLVASGDVDGDGRSDLVYQLTDGSIGLLGGTTVSTGGFAASRPLVMNPKGNGRDLS